MGFKHKMYKVKSRVYLLIRWFYSVKVYQIFQNHGRAKRGDGTAKDGRKTECSSAPYAEAYSPRFCEYMFEFGLDKFLQKKKQHHINFYRTIYRAPGRCVRFCICTASNVHKKDLPRKSHSTENSMNGNEQNGKNAEKI